MSRPFRLLVGIVLGLLLLGTLVAVGDAAVFTPRLNQASRAVSLLDASQEGMVDQETGVRGYLLAPAPRDREFLEPYDRGRVGHATATRELRGISASPRLRQALADRERAASTWQSQWAGSAVGEAYGKPTSEAFLAQGKSMFDDYRRADADAGGLLDARVAELVRRRGILTSAAGVLGPALVAGALYLVVVTRRRLLAAVARPIADVAAAVRAGRDGDLTRAMPTASITELAELGEDVEALFGSLRRRDEELRLHAQELQILGAASRALLTDPDPRTAICRAATALTGSPQAMLFEPDGAGALVSTAGLTGAAGPVVLPLSGGRTSLTAEVYRSRQAVLVDDVRSDPRVLQSVLPGVDPTAAAWLPVMVKDRCLGVLLVALPFQAGAAQLPAALGLLASEAAVAIDRADLHARLARQAGTDPLTGLANRRTWDERLPAELSRALRNGAPLAVAMLDLDHFKAYNDTRGHPAGDRLLRETADRWAGRLRSTDLIARYGGEEFAVALPDCDLDAAVALLDVLRGQVPGKQTCSVGVATWDRFEDPQALLARADAALYEAKHGGRNRVAAAGPVRTPADRTGAATAAATPAASATPGAAAAARG